MMLVLTLAAIIIAYLVLRRTAQGSRREATALPGV
jgi:branched-subunit amino acid ABC-type transport system permease component